MTASPAQVTAAQEALGCKPCHRRACQGSHPTGDEAFGLVVDRIADSVRRAFIEAGDQ